MWTSLCLKELRENALIAALAGIWCLQWLAGIFGSGLTFFGPQPGAVPFLDSQAFHGFLGSAIILAIVLGFHQTLAESMRQTWLFLLHRPAPRCRIVDAKLTAGIGILLTFTVGPLLIYLIYAATPGTHASPFDLEFTVKWWRAVLVAMVVYLSAFLSGLRPARWFGSRIWPLTGVCAASVGLFGLCEVTLFGYLLFPVLALILWDQIQQVAATREYP